MKNVNVEKSNNMRNKIYKGALPMLMRATATIATKVTIITNRLWSLKKNDLESLLD